MIRLARVGATKQPHYRVVVIEKDRARNGRSVEVVGTYNPRTNPATVTFKRDRVEYWTNHGAQLSDRVGKLFAAAPAAEPTAETAAPVAKTAPAPKAEESATKPAAATPEASAEPVAETVSPS